MRISNFSGKFRFLSNFYPAKIIYNGSEYPTSEHFFHAAKTTDNALREKISKLSTPGDAKRAGRKLIKRSDWDNMRISVMSKIVYMKFSQNHSLKQQLLDTGNDYLEEGNTWGDIFWGICDGKGENHLGLILMETREKLRKE
jgi:hypothetical protein